MTQPFIEFPATKLPDHLRGWLVTKIAGIDIILGSDGEALALVVGSPDPAKAGQNEQAALLMASAPEMLLLIETVVEQANAGQKIDLGYLMAMSNRIRRAGQP